MLNKIRINFRVAATIVVACAVLAAAACAPAAADLEPIIGGPCEGCELVFEGIPPSPASEARIAPSDEPGEPLRIEGRVTDASGKPAAGVIVYAYHTDATGIYPRGSTRHGRLRAKVIGITDTDVILSTRPFNNMSSMDAPVVLPIVCGCRVVVREQFKRFEAADANRDGRLLPNELPDFGEEETETAAATAAPVQVR